MYKTKRKMKIMNNIQTITKNEIKDKINLTQKSKQEPCEKHQRKFHIPFRKTQNNVRRT